jgi:CheY-like chemotaxis protein
MARPVVLVGEDDSDARDVASELLSEAGYDVVSADDGREMKRLLEAGLRPDAILLDLTMPRADGYDFLAWRASSPDVRRLPVVIHSASAFNEVLLRLLGVHEVLTKPASSEDMLKAVARAVASGASSRRPGG